MAATVCRIKIDCWKLQRNQIEKWDWMQEVVLMDTMPSGRQVVQWLALPPHRKEVLGSTGTLYVWN